ncbi:hypothetical protein MARPO_0010s0047 [Marchantia polymorpha]|uniref:protein disulfide-isomerase n=1 Tax=Marchantia polymorpha TaxID=3197 RepID=A0A2R6XKJ2_MARPO|nr:hypothetical protein MARPO_0010s0047 [Marchantia polymorpha]|eukprot:PTQ46637.1 hypothetical protein MARPO_0010s0047 [Marchantia polymorpha]
MRRWGLVWVLLLVVTLGLSLPKLIACMEDVDVDAPRAEVDDDDFWEDIEDDEEPATASKSKVSRNLLVQLNDQNSEKILQSNEFVLVLGYASWCRQSAAVMVDFTEAATVLSSKGSPVVLAKIDAIVNQITAGRYKIKGFPTILFFRNGSDEIFPAGLSSDEIVNWIQKQTGHPATTVSSSDEAEVILSKNKTVVIGRFEEFQGSDYEQFLAASMEVSDVEFLRTTEAGAAKAFSAAMADSVPSFGLWKRDEGFETFDGAFNTEDLAAFVNLNKFEVVTQLSSQNVGKIYSSSVKKQVILFGSREEVSAVRVLYKAVAKRFKNALMFVWVDNADEDFAKPMLTMYGIPDDELVVAGFDNSNGLRYVMDAEFNEQNLVTFAEKFVRGNLDLHYKSERIPKENNGDVKVVVGKTFESLVLQSPKDLVLLVHTPYCFDCESMGKAFVKLAKHFKGDSSLIFAKIDASANEHPALKVVNYPAILFYSADGRTKEPEVGYIKPYLKKLVKFVDEQVQRRTAVNSDLSQEDERSETVKEVIIAPDTFIASTITDADSSKVADADSGLKGSFLEVPSPTDPESELIAGTETSAVPPRSQVADASEVVHIVEKENRDREVEESDSSEISHKDEL